MPQTQPLSVVVNVAVQISPVAASSPSFNQGLILGSSSIISAATRVRQYASLAAMTSDGFSSANPEFLAAQLYFSQTPTPQWLWVGRQDLTQTESVLTALQACRAASPTWWGCMSTNAVTADHIAVAGWIQGAFPVGMYFFSTADAAALAGTAGNVLLTMKTNLYSRTFGIYSTTQSGAAPNNAYAAAAAMGVAMGQNTGLANSNFTMKFKQLVGVAAESLTSSQVAVIEGENGNLYLPYATAYSWLEQGVTGSGQYLDEILGLDMLVNDMQYSVANLLISQPAIPHTNAGQAQLMTAVIGACEAAVSRGWIAPGTWTGQQVLTLTAGQPLPRGYMVISDNISKQSQGDRQARKAMPIYVPLVEAGAMHSLTIGVYVQR
jgi:hypothetical protein